MRKILNSIIVCLLLSGIIALTGFRDVPGTNDLSRAKSTLKRIFTLYDAGHDHLLNETYTVKPGNKVSYLAGEDTVTTQRVAYLWPTSGVYSAVNTLLKTTGNREYLTMLEKKVIPGLDQYYDTLRYPPSYQSYISKAGKSDRYYDDNVWLALDFCETFNLTGNRVYLKKSIETWQFIISGWDNNAGGIFWCEQKKGSRNTCSNAPSSVLAFRLFEATGDSSYYKWGLRIYNWTKVTLQDSTDHLYFDNISVTGRISRQKYTYNSGQMLQSAAMLYRLTGNKAYLDEAQQIAASVVNYFTEDYKTSEGKSIRLFKNTGNWFNAILLRGYAELYRIDGNKQYINIFRDNLDQLWNHVRNKDGLFGKDWKGEKEEQYKWLLDQASLVEMLATLARL